MGSWRKYLLQHQSISWTLVILLVLQIVIQLKIHAHHDDHASLSTGNDHVIDFHLITDNHRSNEHSNNENVHELKSTPDFILKKTLDRDFDLLLLVFLLIFVLVPLVTSKGFPLITKNQFISFFYFGLSPPVRAPPAN